MRVSPPLVSVSLALSTLSLVFTVLTTVGCAATPNEPKTAKVSNILRNNHFSLDDDPIADETPQRACLIMGDTLRCFSRTALPNGGSRVIIETLPVKKTE